MPSEPYIQDCKKRGEWAEARFLVRAEELGLNVSKPWGESNRYDFAVEHHGQFLRVQVKSTTARHQDGYICSLKSKSGRTYACNEVDFFAVYLVLEDLWYIIPADLTIRKSSLMIAPGKGHKYEPFKEAWHLLSGNAAANQVSNSLPAEPGWIETEPAKPAPNADPGQIAALSGLAETHDPTDTYAQRLSNSFDFMRRHMLPRRS